jgi:hypothetical protein
VDRKERRRSQWLGWVVVVFLFCQVRGLLWISLALVAIVFKRSEKKVKEEWGGFWGEWFEGKKANRYL